MGHEPAAHARESRQWARAGRPIRVRYPRTRTGALRVRARDGDHGARTGMLFEGASELGHEHEDLSDAQCKQAALREVLEPTRQVAVSLSRERQCISWIPQRLHASQIGCCIASACVVLIECVLLLILTLTQQVEPRAVKRGSERKGRVGTASRLDM